MALPDIKFLQWRVYNNPMDYAQIAERAGLSKSWVSKFATGHISNPRYETMRKIIAALEELE